MASQSGSVTPGLKRIIVIAYLAVTIRASFTENESNYLGVANLVLTWRNPLTLVNYDQVNFPFRT